MRIKSIITIYVCSAVILLNACGSGGEYQQVKETTPENETIDETIDEPVETQEAAEAVSLADITWEDFDDGAWETVLHFSFSNGAIVDKELPLFMTVESVEYRDITGDETDEVIVSGTFANTATEYNVIAFFQIEDDTVKDISPSSELPELADNVWHTTVTDSVEGYTIVLKMESYGKINALAYTEAVMTVGYAKEGWQVIQRKKMPDWVTAYLEYLSTGKILDPAMGTTVYIAEGYPIYLDEDDIPELLYFDYLSGHPGILTCQGTEVVNSGCLLGRSEVWYQEKTGRFVTYYEIGYGSSLFEEWRLVDGRVERIASAEADLDKEPVCYWNAVQISREEYEQRRDDMLGPMTEIDSRMSYDELYGWLIMTGEPVEDNTSEGGVSEEEWEQIYAKWIEDVRSGKEIIRTEWKDGGEVDVPMDAMGSCSFGYLNWGAAYPVLCTITEMNSADSIELQFYMIIDGNVKSIVSYHPGMGMSSWWDIAFLDGGKYYFEARKNYGGDAEGFAIMRYSGTLYELEDGKTSEVWSANWKIQYEARNPITGGGDFLTAVADADQFSLKGKDCSIDELVKGTDKLIGDGAAIQLLDYLAKEGGIEDFGKVCDGPLKILNHQDIEWVRP